MQCLHSARASFLFLTLCVGEVPLHHVGALVCCQVAHIPQNHSFFL